MLHEHFFFQFDFRVGVHVYVRPLRTSQSSRNSMHTNETTIENGERIEIETSHKMDAFNGGASATKIYYRKREENRKQSEHMKINS